MVDDKAKLVVGSSENKTGDTGEQDLKIFYHL